MRNDEQSCAEAQIMTHLFGHGILDGALLEDETVVGLGRRSAVGLILLGQRFALLDELDVVRQSVPVLQRFSRKEELVMVRRDPLLQYHHPIPESSDRGAV